MKRLMFRMLAIFMFIAFCETLPSVCLAEEGKWTKKADMPTKRAWLSTSAVNGKIYAIGGSGGQSMVEAYDPKADSWTKKANMPTGRGGLSASVVKGKIYAIGGGSGGAVEEYNPAADTWTKKTDMPTKRWLLSTSAVNGKIYAIGGEVPNIFGGVPFATVEEYDPATDKWTKKADMPTARSDFATSMVDGNFYAVGFISGVVTLATVDVYDPATDKWKRRADMPTARQALATSAVNGKIYAIGGISGGPLSTVEVYDAKTNKWTKTTDMPTMRGELSASAVSGQIYAIGGAQVWWPPKPMSTVEAYDTGFRIVEAKGKLTILWGRLKAEP